MVKTQFKFLGDQLKASNRLLFILCVTLILLLFYNVWRVERAIKKEKIIIIPPNISQPVEFLGGTVSDSYLREMGRFLIMTALNYQPYTVKNTYEDLLHFYAPEVFEETKQKFYNYVNLVNKVETTSIFFVNNVEVSPSSEIIVKGIRRKETKNINGTIDVENVNESWKIRYRVEGTKFYVLSIDIIE